jgi:hypothetical protein
MQAIFQFFLVGSLYYLCSIYAVVAIPRDSLLVGEVLYKVYACTVLRVCHFFRAHSSLFF